MNVSIPRRTLLDEWSLTNSNSSRSRLILLLVVIFADGLWRYSRGILSKYIDSPIILDWTIEIGVVSLITITVCVATQLVIGVSIKEVLGFPVTDSRDLLKWAYVGIAASSYNYILEVPSGFGPQFTFELWFLFIRLLRSSILVPIYEEIVYRFVIYGLFRTKLSWWPAAFCSAMVFFIAHFRFISQPWVVILQLILFYISFGLLTAYLYETRRVLLPCIVVHSIVNFTYFSAPLIGYLLFGTIATTDPPTLQ